MSQYTETDILAILDGLQSASEDEKKALGEKVASEGVSPEVLEEITALVERESLSKVIAISLLDTNGDPTLTQAKQQVLADLSQDEV